MVVLDFGVFYKGLASDMTRMVAVGEPNKEVIKIYKIVREALERATLLVRDGVKGSKIDIAARSFIKEKGYGDKFIHTTGHGLGREVHEEPKIFFQDHTILKEGMVITIEPGIYLKGNLGVRLENDILVTKDGYEVLNKSSLDY